MIRAEVSWPPDGDWGGWVGRWVDWWWGAGGSKGHCGRRGLGEAKWKYMSDSIRGGSKTV